MAANERRVGVAFFYAVILGVLGNALVSFAFELFRSKGFERGLMTIGLAICWIAFFAVYRQASKLFAFPMRRINIVVYGFLIFLAVWAVLMYLMGKTAYSRTGRKRIQ